MRERERRAKLEEVVQRIDGLMGSCLEDSLQDLGPECLGEVIALALERQGVIDRSKHLVVMTIMNRIVTHDGKSDSLRCEVCQEVLSQRSVQAQPASYSRENGRPLVAAIPVCGHSCGKRLVGASASA